MPTPPDMNARPEEGAKLSHAEVHYGLAKPGGDRCVSCEYFHGKNQCDLVVAPIYPAGWCEKFQAKAADAAGESSDTEVAEQSLRAAPAGNPLAHGRAIAGAKALHAVGHISAGERDKHMRASQAALKKAPVARKAFGSWAP